MKILGLFGDSAQEIKDKAFEEEYTDYINSSAWHRLRDAKIKAVGGVCEKCGISKWSMPLEVHHLNYDRFKHERLSDLQVLCHPCHTGADVKRQEEVIERREDSSIIRGFENWMDRGKDKQWRRFADWRLSKQWKLFLKSLERRTGRHYDIPFWRSPEW